MQFLKSIFLSLTVLRYLCRTLPKPVTVSNTPTFENYTHHDDYILLPFSSLSIVSFKLDLPSTEEVLYRQHTKNETTVSVFLYLWRYPEMSGFSFFIYFFVVNFLRSKIVDYRTKVYCILSF